MAEGGLASFTGDRRLVTIVAVVVLFIVLFFAWSLRGCVPGVKAKSYQTVYSNLDLKDAANVIARLKELKIPYELKEDGTAISVPKERADDARLGLAEKNLPVGGMVGWEIFNETRMGATDFDRRIQLIRAISGELSRTIRRLQGVEDARVQIVIPETRLFEVTKVPVTAAVLLKIAPGFRLSPEQVSGIVHLTASSVENLQPENVTVVDEGGNILTSKYPARVAEELGPPPPLITTVESQAPLEQKIIKKVEAASPELAAPVLPLTPEEKALLRLKAKGEYENQLSSKVQELLNQFYPLNSVLVKVDVELGAPPRKAPPKKKPPKKKIKTNPSPGLLTQPVKKIRIVILVDQRIAVSPELKKITYQTVASAIPYNKKRGDRIVLRKVPFHYALPLTPQKPVEKPPVKGGWLGYAFLYYILAAAALFMVLFFVIRTRMKKIGTAPFAEMTEISPVPTEREAVNAISEIKNMAAREPQKIASLLRKWLTEER